MGERFPNMNGHNGYEDNDSNRANASETHEMSRVPVVEPDSDAEWQLRWAVSEALLRAVYDMVEHPGEDSRAAAVTVAIEVVQAIRSFDLNDEDDQHALALRADYIADRLVGLVGEYEDLTTGDLQGSVEVLALMLVRGMLPGDPNAPTDR